jgi:hypothetical protein
LLAAGSASYFAESLSKCLLLGFVLSANRLALLSGGVAFGAQLVRRARPAFQTFRQCLALLLEFFAQGVQPGIALANLPRLLVAKLPLDGVHLLVVIAAALVQERLALACPFFGSLVQSLGLEPGLVALPACGFGGLVGETELIVAGGAILLHLSDLMFELRLALFGFVPARGSLGFGRPVVGEQLVALCPQGIQFPSELISTNGLVCLGVELGSEPACLDAAAVQFFG